MCTIIKEFTASCCSTQHLVISGAGHGGNQNRFCIWESASGECLEWWPLLFCISSLNAVIGISLGLYIFWKISIGRDLQIVVSSGGNEGIQFWMVNEKNLLEYSCLDGFTIRSIEHLVVFSCLVFGRYVRVSVGRTQVFLHGCI